MQNCYRETHNEFDWMKNLHIEQWKNWKDKRRNTSGHNLIWRKNDHKETKTAKFICKMSLNETQNYNKRTQNIHRDVEHCGGLNVSW